MNFFQNRKNFLEFSNNFQVGFKALDFVQKQFIILLNDYYLFTVETFRVIFSEKLFFLVRQIFYYLFFTHWTKLRQGIVSIKSFAVVLPRRFFTAWRRALVTKN